MHDLASLFCFAEASAQPFAAVRVDIVSNYGNVDFTCLYRVRIHGTPA